MTELTIYTADHPGLFSHIAGAISIAGGSIEGARIFTLANGMALDTFWVKDSGGGRLDSGSRLAKLSATIEKVLSGTLKPQTEIAKQAPSYPSRFDVFKVAPRVLIDNKGSSRHTVIEVNGRDQPGLLYRVTAALTRLNLIIISAKITTLPSPRLSHRRAVARTMWRRLKLKTPTPVPMPMPMKKAKARTDASPDGTRIHRDQIDRRPGQPR